MSDKTAQQVVHHYFIHAHSPVHVGIGEGLGAINLPITREAATEYPYLPGSSVKGILREAAEQLGTLGARSIHSAFGPPKEHAGDARGGLVISDASLLCLPVRSLVGVFAWMTCPFILRRLARDARETGLSDSEMVQAIGRLDASLRSAARDEEAKARGEARAPGVRVTPESLLVARGGQDRGRRVLFVEDLSLSEEEHWRTDSDLQTLGRWLAAQIWPKDDDAGRDFLERLLLVPDDIFSYFHRHATEVRSRVHIDASRGTAADSGPWTEEYLPAETLLFGVVIGRATVYVNREKKLAGGSSGAGEAPVIPEELEVTERRPGEALETLASVLAKEPVLRVGGKSTGGSGRVRIRVSM
jgi:CRISPR-associated protein Cmr4